MGYDISNHPIDVALIQQRLVPALLEGGDIGDLLEQAAQRCAIGHLAKRWSMKLLDLDQRIGARQREAAPPRVVTQRKPAPGWRGRLGLTVDDSFERPARCTGLPGFDSDLTVWGRPYCIVAHDTDAALVAFEAWRRLGPEGACDAVNELGSQAVAALEQQRHRLHGEYDPKVLEILDEFYPLEHNLVAPDEEEDAGIDVERTRQRLEKRWALLRAAWVHRHDTAHMLDSDLLNEPASAAELSLELPFSIINLAAQLLPGWMGRGYVWPTALFERIGVPVSNLFEPATSLFDALVREHPALEQRLPASIPENYSLGGYVPPPKVAALRTLLETHRRDLILAWHDDKKVPDDELEVFAADYRKIIEPVTYAERKGHGFMEAAEVYSGFLGVLNV